MKLKSLKLAAAAAIIVVGLTACAVGPQKTSGQAAEDKQQAQSSESLVNNQPLPHFNHSQYRQGLIDIETAQANGVQTTSFFFNLGAVDPNYVCPSIGTPIPNTASLSNPQQVVEDRGDRNGGNVTVGQMDPNGVYTPSSSTGTFVECVGADGSIVPLYHEGTVQTVFAPAKWNITTHSIELVGPASFNFKRVTK